MSESERNGRKMERGSGKNEDEEFGSGSGMERKIEDGSGRNAEGPSGSGRLDHTNAEESGRSEGK